MMNELFLNRSVLLLDLGEEQNLKPYRAFQHRFRLSLNGGLQQQRHAAVERLPPRCDIPHPPPVAGRRTALHAAGACTPSGLPFLLFFQK